MALYFTPPCKEITMKHRIILLFFTFTAAVYGQKDQVYIQKAENAIIRTKYQKALQYYDKALAINSGSYTGNAGKGMLLGEYMGQYEEAIPYLEAAVKEGSKDSLLTLYYILAKCYHFMGEYNKALVYYDKLKDREEIGNPMFSRYVKKNTEDCRYALSHQEAVQSFTIKNAGAAINSDLPEYAPVVTNKGEMIFTSKRKDHKKEKINPWDGKYFESMYISRYENGQFSSPALYIQPDSKVKLVNGKGNESSVFLSSDGNSFFIYKNGDIYLTPLNDPSRKAEKLSKEINMARYQNHATLTADNQTIYFTSEAKGGMGGTDIYRSVKKANGEWSKAELLDSTINTIFNEDAPFIASDGTLYFASEGHPGYGGFDIYKTHFENGHWTKPENLGLPVNSPGQDLFFNLKGGEMYYSSYRKGGFGDMDIYYAESAEQKNLPIAAIPLAEKTDSMPLAVPENTVSTTYLTEKDLKAINWISNPIPFSYNSKTLSKEAMKILDHNIKVLKERKNLTFDIRGYSDSRGAEKYNLRLSKDRADAVKNYLLSKEIAEERIKNTTGYGESALINNCNEKECTEEQHKANRRVEIGILKESYQPENVTTKGIR
jgi:outer membrane protein OmpA-like peptidoglycan-associated protein